MGATTAFTLDHGQRSRYRSELLTRASAVPAGTTVVSAGDDAAMPAAEPTTGNANVATSKLPGKLQSSVSGKAKQSTSARFGPAVLYAQFVCYFCYDASQLYREM